MPPRRDRGARPAPIHALERLSGGLAVLEGVGIGACLLVIVVLAVWQFLERNLVLHHVPFFAAPGWADGVIRHSVFLLGFLGGAYATHSRRHIRIDAVSRVAPHRLRLGMQAVTTLAALVVLGLFVHAAWGFYEVTLEEAGDPSQARQLVTTAHGALIMVGGYAAAFLHFLIHLLLDLWCLLSGQAPPPPRVLAEAPVAPGAVALGGRPTEGVP